MTEAGTGRAPGRTGTGEYSKDYWDLVFEQLAKRRLFKLALAVLVLLYGSAIYAPFLANDRPFVLEAINYEEYDQARRSLYPVTLGLRGLVKQTPEEYLTKRTEGSDQTYEEALEAERQALAVRAETLSKYLPEEHHGPIAEFLDAADETIALATAGDHAGAEEAGGALKDRAKELRDQLEPARPPEPGEPGETEDSEEPEEPEEPGEAPESGAEEPAEPEGLALQGVVSYPIFEATTKYEVFFMVLWAFVLLWPVWNRAVNVLLLRRDRERIRSWRKRKLVTVLAVSVLSMLAWMLTVDGEMTFYSATYKERLTSGAIVAERVVFPPITLGFAEQHNEEIFRPPTWTASSEIDEKGAYVHGARVPKKDEKTGFQQKTTPVNVLYGEADRNSGFRHVLGTDSLGRDLLVRSLYGGRVSLSVGIVSTVILMIIGIVVGSLAGFFGGKVDLVISRVIEVVICFPVFFLILVVVAFVGPSILNIMVVIGLLRWTGVARLARGEFLRLKELDFVVAARALGLSSQRTVFRHILPNAMGPLLVAGSFAVAAGILIESGLSFLGFGVQRPIPSWGSLVTETRNAAFWWIHVFPGALIFLTVLCYNLVGDAIRDAMDPKMKV